MSRRGSSGLQEVVALDDLEQQESRSIAGSKNSAVRPASRDRQTAQRDASGTKLNLGRNMAVMNRMLEKQAADGSGSARGSARGSASGRRKRTPSQGSAGGRQLALINEQGSFMTDSSLDSVELAERDAMLASMTKTKKEKKSVKQMEAEVGGRDRDYEAGKTANKLHKEFDQVEVEIKQCKRLIERRRRNPLGGYTNRDFLKIFVINNLALIVLGFMFSTMLFDIMPGGGGFTASQIQAESVQVRAPDDVPASEVVPLKARFTSLSDRSSLVLQSATSSVIGYGLEGELPSYRLQTRGPALDLTRDGGGATTKLMSFVSDEVHLNAGVPFDPDDPERSPDRLVKISEAGGAVSLGGSIFMMPQGFLGNSSIRVAPVRGKSLFLRPIGDAGVKVNAGMSLDGSLRVGKDLQSDEPCARGVTVQVEPEEESVQFGSEFNDIDLRLEGTMSHQGDIIVQNGGLRMGTGDLTVANFDFSRARKASFMSRKARLGIKNSLNDPEVDVRGHLQFLDSEGAIYLSFDPQGLGYTQARNMTVRNSTWLQANVVIGGGKRDPMPGWVMSCDLQRRGGGSGSCASATDYRLENEPGLLTVHAGQTSMLNVNVGGDACIGQRCVTPWSINSTVPKGTVSVVGKLKFWNDHGDMVGEVLAGRASVLGRYNVSSNAHLKAGVTLSGAQDPHAKLRVLGPAVCAGPVHMTDGTLRVVGRAGLANAHTLQTEITELLTVCNGIATTIGPNGSVVCPPRFIADAASASAWANGSATIAGTTTLMQNVVMGVTNSTHAEAFGRVETRHALQTGSMHLSPRINHHVAWVHGSIETILDSLPPTGGPTFGPNHTVVDVYQRRAMNISGSFSSRGVHVGPRRNQSYVDMDWLHQAGGWNRNDTLSTFTVAGSSGMSSLRANGMLRVASQNNSATLFAANPGAGDTMVRESLITRGHSVVNGAEFGPVQVYSYSLDFENSSVMDWAVEEDPRCYLSAMPPHVCDMAQHWNQYECFSLWQQGTLGRDEQCTLQFNSTRAHINIRVPLEEIYYKLVVPDPLLPEETVRVPFDPPVFLRTLAPADTTIRSSLHVNRSASLDITSVDGSALVLSNAELNGTLVVGGNVTLSQDVNVRGQLFSVHQGHVKFSVVPDVDSAGGGSVFTYGGLHVNGTGLLPHAVEFGESPVDSLHILASLRFNNTLQTADMTAGARLNALSPVQMVENLEVWTNTSFTSGATLVGNLVFESDVHRTFIVEAWSKTTTSAGSFHINGSMHVHNLVSTPALTAGSLYIAQVNGTTPAGVLIEGVPIGNGGIAKPRVDELVAQYDGGILVDGVRCLSGTLSMHENPQEDVGLAAAQPAANESQQGALVTMVNSGHARYMADTVSSLAFFHHGHPASALSGSELSHQSASLTVGTESDWSEAPASRNAYLSARTVAAGVLRERFRIRSNGDVLFNEGLGEMIADTGRLTVRGDFSLLQRRSIELVDDDGGDVVVVGNQTGNGTVAGNATGVNATLSNQTVVEDDDDVDEEETIDPAFLVPKLMHVSSNGSSVTATVSSGGNTHSSLQLRSAHGVFDMAFMREQEIAGGSNDCTTDYVDTGSILRVRGTQKELLSIETSGSEAYVWNRGSASICNASAEYCGVSVLSAEEAKVEVKSGGGDAVLTVQSGWSHRVRVSFVDAARNGKNSTFHLTASGSHVCRDDFEWSDPISGKTCRYYYENDPGCVAAKANRRLPAVSNPLVPCVRTCELCDGGLPTPHLDIEGGDGSSILHLEDHGDMSTAQIYGDVVFGYCFARNHFGACSATPRDISVAVYSRDESARVNVLSSHSDAALRVTSGAFGAAGVRFAQPTSANGSSSAFQMSKRGSALEFIDGDSNLLGKLETERSSVGDLHISGSATFGSLTDETHRIVVRSSRAAKCKVQSQSTAVFAVRAGFGRNASLELVTPRTQQFQHGNDTLERDLGASQFSFVNDGAGLAMTQQSTGASGNASQVRNVLSLVYAADRGDLTFDGDGVFCNTDSPSTGASSAPACGVRVESAGHAEVSVAADNGTADVLVIPAPGQRATLDLQTRSNSTGAPRVVRLWTQPSNGSLILSSGVNDSSLMLTLRRVPGQATLPGEASVVEESVPVADNSTNATEEVVVATVRRKHYGFINVLGNGNFGVNATESASVSLRSANSSRVLIGSSVGSPNASGLLSVQSNTGAFLRLSRAANGSVASTFDIVARTDDPPCQDPANSTENASHTPNSTLCDDVARQDNNGNASNRSTRLFVEAPNWSVLSIEPRTVARHIRQHSIYSLTASEFFCKVAFVDVVEACAGSAPDPQTAWGSLLLRECTVPCYVNLMPWYTACGEQLQTFQELSAEQVAIIQLQRTVCADYYGPYTGPASEVEANALPLFHDLEQTQGPFGANASTENTRVVQTRVQEIHANETAAVVGISCSVTFGQADLDLPRRVSVETKGSAKLSVQSMQRNSSLNIRAGAGSNASLSFERTNDLPNRRDLIVDATSNESISTPQSMHTSTVHRFQWAVAGNGTLDLLGYSVRRQDQAGSLLMPTMSETSVSLFSIEDRGDVGSIALGGSASFGVAAYDGSGSLFRTAEQQSRFAQTGASLINADAAGLTLSPVNQAVCYAAGLGAFCQTGPSEVTPATGGAVNLDVVLRHAELLVPGGACRSTADPSVWTFGPTSTVAANVTLPDGSLGTTTEVVMQCSAGSDFTTPSDAAEVRQIAAAAEAWLPQLAADTFASAATLSPANVTSALHSVAGAHDAAVVVQSSDAAAKVSAIAGRGKWASLVISSGARLPAVNACTTQPARVNWTDFAFMDTLNAAATNVSGPPPPPLDLPSFSQNFSVSDSCRQYAQRTPRSTLKLVSGASSSLQLDAYTTESATSSLLFKSAARDLMSIESSANSSTGSAFHLRVLGNAAIGAQCPPNCNTSSMLQVLSPNSTSMNVVAGASDAALTVASQEGASSVIHLRQAHGSVFTLQHVGTHIELAHHVAPFPASVQAPPYPAVEIPDDASALLEVSNVGVKLTGTVSSRNLQVSGSSSIGADVSDPAIVAGSLTNLNLLVKPAWEANNYTYNLTMTDPERVPCVDEDVTQYTAIGDCQATLTYIGQSGQDCFSNIESFGIPRPLAELCPLTCDTCPDASESSRTIDFLPSVNNNPLANLDHAAKVLTSVSDLSILTEVGTLVGGTIAEGFGSIATDQDITTTAGGQIIAGGTLSANGPVEVRGASYLGGVIIEYFSFSSIAPVGVFTENLGLVSSEAKLVSLSGGDKTTSLRGVFDPGILESVEPTCQAFLNADGTVCVRGQREIVVPDMRPDDHKELMVIHYDYGAVNEVNQVYMTGTSGEIESHPDQLISAGRASFISVYNSLVKTTSIVLAQVSNTGVGGTVVVQAVTVMTVDGGFTITVRNIDPDNDMTTTFKVSYVLFL